MKLSKYLPLLSALFLGLAFNASSFAAPQNFVSKSQFILAGPLAEPHAEPLSEELYVKRVKMSKDELEVLTDYLMLHAIQLLDKSHKGQGNYADLQTSFSFICDIYTKAKRSHKFAVSYPEYQHLVIEEIKAIKAAHDEWLPTVKEHNESGEYHCKSY